VRIGIVGGSGDFGRGLGQRLEAAGEQALLGSRNPHGDLLPNEVVCERADLVFLSVPPEGVEDMAAQLAPRLAGKIVVSVASPVVFREGKPAADPGELSLAERAARAAPGAVVVAGFHTVSAKALARPEQGLDEDVLLAGDDRDAKAIVAALAERIVTGRAVDAGRLEVARWIEPLTAVLMNVNRRYKTQSGVRITGLDD
jgi:8-hydroxy-5-deazaflavin:NADPH oxidoreductase